MQGYLAPNRFDLTIQQNCNYFYSYCGLCQGLKEGYGKLARFLVNKDALVLQLLIESQLNETPEQRKIRCGVRLGGHIGQGHPLAVEFAAAVNIIITWETLQDIIKDAKGYREFPNKKAAELQLWLGRNKVKKAEKILNELGFDVNIIYQLFDQQQKMEQSMVYSNLEEISSQTAQGLQALFVHTAVLANCPDNIEVLKTIGREVGSIIYLLDARDDLDMDVKKGNFNPLKIISKDQTLKSDVLTQLPILLNKKHEFVVEASTHFKFKNLQHQELLKNIFISNLRHWIKGTDKRIKQITGLKLKMKLAGDCDCDPETCLCITQCCC